MSATGFPVNGDSDDEFQVDTTGFYEEARCGGDRPGFMDNDAGADGDYPDDEDDVPPYGEVYSRALRASGGKHELAAEAMKCPGDFI